MVHGFGATPEELRPLGEVVSVAGFSARGVLLPGHGTTVADFARHGRAAWSRAVDDAVADLRAAGHTVAIAGMSMGALLALTSAARMPDAVAALVLCGTALEITDRRAGMLGLLAGAPLLARLLPPLPKPGGRGISDPVARAASPAYDRLPLSALAEFFALQADARRTLPGVRQPTLVLHGRHDQAVPVGVVERVRRELGSEWIDVHVLERSWHVVTLDVERAAVGRLVVDFLERVEALRP
jgi:carboxylesterase